MNALTDSIEDLHREAEMLFDAASEAEIDAAAEAAFAWAEERRAVEMAGDPWA